MSKRALIERFVQNTFLNINLRSLCAHLAAANCFTIDHLEKPENKALMEKAEFYYIAVSSCQILLHLQ